MKIKVPLSEIDLEQVFEYDKLRDAEISLDIEPTHTNCCCRLHTKPDNNEQPFSCEFFENFHGGHCELLNIDINFDSKIWEYIRPQECKDREIK